MRLHPAIESVCSFEHPTCCSVNSLFQPRFKILRHLFLSGSKLFAKRPAGLVQFPGWRSVPACLWFGAKPRFRSRREFTKSWGCSRRSCLVACNVVRVPAIVQRSAHLPPGVVLNYVKSAFGYRVRLNARPSGIHRRDRSITSTAFHMEGSPGLGAEPDFASSPPTMFMRVSSGPGSNAAPYKQ